jgi:hypothetical protein
MTRDQANLEFDSFTAPLPQGIRHSNGDVRHLVYKGSLLEITLQVNTNSTSMTILGQLTSGTDKRIVQDARVCLVDDRHRLETLSDKSGQFLFEAIPAQSYSVEIIYDDVGVTIDRVPPPKRA